MSNLILSPQVFQAHRLVVTHETFLLAEGDTAEYRRDGRGEDRASEGPSIHPS